MALPRLKNVEHIQWHHLSIKAGGLQTAQQGTQPRAFEPKSTIVTVKKVTLAQSHISTHRHRQTQPQTDSHTHTQTHTDTHTHTHRHTDTHKHKQTHTHRHTHRHTQTQTQTDLLDFCTPKVFCYWQLEHGFLPVIVQKKQRLVLEVVLLHSAILCNKGLKDNLGRPVQDKATLQEAVDEQTHAHTRGETKRQGKGQRMTRASRTRTLVDAVRLAG